METMDEQYIEIFRAIVDLLKKLELLSKDKDQGARILLLFLKDINNQSVIIAVYRKLLDTLVQITKEIEICASCDEMVIEKITPQGFYHSHLQAFQLLPTLL